MLFAVPEYAFGIPGAFKNALDWTVGSGSLYRKPVTLLNIAPVGRGACVRETLGFVMRALDVDVCHVSVPVSSREIDTSGEIDDATIIAELGALVAELADRATAASAA